jgi:Icc-related predicted phosphoesterase
MTMLAAARPTAEHPAAGGQVLRVAAVGDLHYTRTSQGSLQPLFAQAAEAADVLVLCGDLTDSGLAEEAHILAHDLTVAAKIPIIAVLGNHDVESGSPAEVVRILTDAGVRVLDGDAHEVQGVGFAGVKGFAGGFASAALQPWGEPTIKSFVREAVDESLKLESALARLRVAARLVVLHYAPIRATVEGEPADIIPFLGSSRLEEPINRYAVTAVVHGHARHGRLEGRTSAHIPVYNVSLPLLKRTYPDRPPFRLLELPMPAPEPGHTQDATTHGRHEDPTRRRHSA